MLNNSSVKERVKGSLESTDNGMAPLSCRVPGTPNCNGGEGKVIMCGEEGGGSFFSL